jgi:tripartite motif-containing protein 71
MKSKHMNVFSLIVAGALALVTMQPAQAQDIATVAATEVAQYGPHPGVDPVPDDKGRLPFLPHADLSMPSDTGVTDKGWVWVVDGGNHQLVLFDKQGRRQAVLGGPGKDEGQFQGPVGMDLGPKGELYVADRGNNRIQVFDSKLRFSGAIAVKENGKVANPVDVAVGPRGKELFVTTSSHRVLVFDTKGKLLRAWGGEGSEDGQFKYPAGITVDGDGAVYVVDVINQRVQKFDAEGAFLAAYGTLGATPGNFFRPKGVAVDASGNIYVSDSYLGVIQVLSPTGEFLHALGEGGVPTRYETPVGMSVHQGRLYVTLMLPGKVSALEVAK